MINTNRLDYKKDLEEVIYMFCDGENINITHVETNNGFNFKDVFEFNGKTYTFDNQKEIDGDLELKRYEKRFSKLGLYKILVKHFNASYEWGALTGIRPVKMAYSLGDNFEKEFKETFDVTDKKTNIVKEIIKTQENILDKNGEYSDFFVGIPFCPSRCLYCSFISEVITKSKLVKKYVQALKVEIENSLKLINNCRSIYVGGGTPICLDYEDLEEILKSLLPISNCVKEFTVEAGRPDSITLEKLELLKKYNVNRICVNPQTLKDETLKLIGRNHDTNSFYSVYSMAKDMGFIINVDIIAGLPSESVLDFKNTVDKVLSLKPDNFTVHTLCLKKGSKLKQLVKRLEVNEISKMLDYAYEKSSESGYSPYYLYRQKYACDNLENIGYSLKGKESVYNIDVMEETSNNVACGANAVSKRVINSKNLIERYGAPKDILTYINKIDEINECKKQLFLLNR